MYLLDSNYTIHLHSQPGYNAHYQVATVTLHFYSRLLIRRVQNLRSTVQRNLFCKYPCYAGNMEPPEGCTGYQKILSKKFRHITKGQEILIVQVRKSLVS